MHKKDIPIKKLTISKSSLEKQIIPLLKNTVFHCTSLSSYQGILESNAIYNNLENRFEYSFSVSSNSYGRKKGYVCLFDFRNKKNKTIIEELLPKFYFLNPSFCKGKVVYFILNPSLYSNLIPNEKAKEEVGFSQMWIPYEFEVWYEEKISMDGIKEIIIVDIPDSEYREKMEIKNV